MLGKGKLHKVPSRRVIVSLFATVLSVALISVLSLYVFETTSTKFQPSEVRESTDHATAKSEAATGDRDKPPEAPTGPDAGNPESIGQPQTALAPTTPASQAPVPTVLAAATRALTTLMPPDIDGSDIDGIGITMSSEPEVYLDGCSRDTSEGFSVGEFIVDDCDGDNDGCISREDKYQAGGSAGSEDAGSEGETGNEGAKDADGNEGSGSAGSAGGTSGASGDLSIGITPSSVVFQPCVVTIVYGVGNINPDRIETIIINNETLLGNLVFDTPTPKSNNWSFLGWAPNDPSLLISEDLTITAQWMPLTNTDLTSETQLIFYYGDYKITATSTGNGSNLRLRYIVEKFGIIVFDSGLVNPGQSGTFSFAYTIRLENEDIVLSIDISGNKIEQTSIRNFANSFTVTYLPGLQGRFPSSPNFGVKVGSPVPAPPLSYNVPKDPGYSFVGWSDGTNMYSTAALPSVTQSVTYTAQWEPNWYQILFYPIPYEFTSTAVEGSMAAQDVAYESWVSLDTNTYTRAGYSFLNWIGGDGTLWSDEQEFTYTIVGNLWLYATWQLDCYDIIYFMGGGINNPDNPKTYTIEDTPIPLGAPTKIGYDFLNWQDSVGNRITGIPAGGTGYRMYWAIWSDPIVYTITYKLDGGTNHPDNPATYTIKDTPIKIADPVRDGYEFLGWQEASTIEAGETGNRAFTAQWSDAIEYTISYDLRGGINNPGNPGSYTVEDTPITLKAPGYHGYEFIGWEDEDGNIVTGIPAGGAGNRTFRATWVSSTDITYVVHYRLVNTVIAVAPDKVVTGQTMSATITENAIAIVEYSSLAPVSQTIELQAFGNEITFYYDYSSHTVTFQNWDGTVLLVQTVRYGNSATAPADPTREDHRFSGWDKNYTLVTSNLLVTAMFVPVQPVTPTIVPEDEEEPEEEEPEGTEEQEEGEPEGEPEEQEEGEPEEQAGQAGQAERTDNEEIATGTSEPSQPTPRDLFQITPTDTPVDKLALATRLATATEPILHPLTPRALEDALSWSLLNLIFWVVDVLIILVLFAPFFKKRKEDEGEKKRLWPRNVTIPLAITAIALFFITENLTFPLGWANEWTIWHAVIFAAVVSFAAIALFKKNARGERNESQVQLAA